MHSILHITYDYAEENIGKSTVAVKELINLSEYFSNNYIISLNRGLKLRRNISIISERKLIKIDHFGLPAGIFIKTNMQNIANYILKNYSIYNLPLDKMDFVHTHKLTFEGFVGYHLAKKLKKKLIISIRQTDFYVLKYRPDLIRIAKKILVYCSAIFYIAPYMLNNLKMIFGDEFYNAFIKNKSHFLPNAIDLKVFETSISDFERNKLVTICWLKKEVVYRKNIYNLLKAMKLLNDQNIHLDIIGHGNFDYKVKQWIKKFKLQEQVNLIGFISNENIPSKLSKACAFVMPSKSETFGVSYAEALCSGVPILYSVNTGFDGIYQNVGVAVDPNSPVAIAKGIKDIIENNQYYRENIRNLKIQNAFKIFSKSNVASVYKQVLDKLI